MPKDFSADVWLGVGIGFAQESEWDTLSLVLGALQGLNVRVVLTSGEVLTHTDGSECVQLADLRVHQGDEGAPADASEIWGGVRIRICDDDGEPTGVERVIDWEEVARVEVY